MARFIPPMPDSFNGSIGEEKVFTALRILDNSYTVFHSFSWIGLGNRTEGEADFVIIHPQKGIMVIEVKSGEIEYKDGQWVQTNTLTRYSKKIAPFDQARRSQYEIIDRLNSGLRHGRIPLVCRTVWFPSIRICETDRLPPEAPKVIVFDETTLNDSKKAIDNAYEYWANKKVSRTSMDPRQLNEVIETVAPHFHVVPGIKGIINETEQIYIKLTNQQAALLDYLKEQRYAVIHGLAGTGKTVLAKEKAKMLTQEGNTVLFLCFNSFLRDYLKNNYSQPGVIYHNAHSLAMEILDDPSIGIDKLLNELEDFLEMFEPEDWPYTHVVIDEGQDLNDRLVNRLYELTKAKGGTFYVFYDRNQYVMKNEMPTWIEQAECKLVLHRNCRNTAEIVKTAYSLIPADITFSENQVRGETPIAVFYTNKEELLAAASKFVKTAIVAGIEPEQIVFLTAETEQKSFFSDVNSIAGINVSNGIKDGNILFTTIRKFKGLEAKALMLIDVSLTSLTNPEKQRLVYVGCSRAKHLLKIAILEDLDSENFGDCLRKINPTRNVPKNKKGLGRLLNVRVES